MMSPNYYLRWLAAWIGYGFYVNTGGDAEFQNEAKIDTVIDSGRTAFHPNLNIPSAITYTVTGELHCTRQIVVDGTIVVNGTLYVV